MLTMEKLDLKKQWKHLYQPPTGEITTVTVPPLTYLMVDGQGDPNKSKAFEQAVEALYSLSYTLKFSLKKKSPRHRLRRHASRRSLVGRRSSRLFPDRQIRMEVDRNDPPARIHLPRERRCSLR